ncbi:MAG: CehA/McbA family metallohydrolase [Rhodanobacteraceae bacterium]
MHQQVNLPHPYYWNGLYLPQLTSGPSAVSFMPDGNTLVYSMQGSLWQQSIGSDEAVELTHAARAYDYQPDVAHDGSSVVFARDDGNAIELWRLDLANRHEQPLTAAGAVNVEPRLSPDGSRIAWVSTQGTGHINLFIADVDYSGLHHPRMLLGEHRSVIDRYYYSAFDVQINPSWSPDGKTIYFVSNPEVGWGTGDLWSVATNDPTQRRKILSEETNWSAHPELAPEGKRLLYSSYRGRNRQQLWLTTPNGAAPLPLTFGDFDRRNARWSQNGQHIAYIDNRDGSTTLRVLDVPGGATRTVAATRRRNHLAQAQLAFDIVDEHGTPVPARVAVLASDGRAYAPDAAWMYGEDGINHAVQDTETHYFHCATRCVMSVPVGPVRVWVQHGFAYAPWQKTVTLEAGRTTEIRAALEPHRLPAAFGDWISADLHIHMNYGGHYRNTSTNLVGQARAEDLDLAYDLVVNKEERVPDAAAFCIGRDPASTAQTLLLHGQEYHSNFWGHVGLLGLDDHLLWPGFAAYRHTAMASPYPDNGTIADLAHAQGGLVGYAHPFDKVPDPAQDPVLSNELPADVIHGKVDYIEIVGFSDHKATAQVWYRLMNLGFHLPAGAGSDAMANHASLHGPVGLGRVFLDTGGARDAAAAMNALKRGRGFASNGPLLGLLLDRAKPGDTLAAPGQHRYRVAMRSSVALDHLELVQNGKVLKAFALTGDSRHFDDSGEINLDGGWVLLRAWNDGSDPLVLDIYPYATTNPVWIGDHVLAPSASIDAAWFAAWLTRVISAASTSTDYNTPEERRITLDYLTSAREAYLKLESAARASSAVQGDQ